MFTVPEKYIDNNHLELMLKELSFLFFQLYKVHPQYVFDIHVAQMIFHYKVEKRGKLYQFTVRSDNFMITFLASTDGLIFKNCHCFVDSKEVQKETLINFTENKGLVQLLRNKINNKKENFI